ncbi:unnamed protein product [Linum trigynum]|uniref:RNase H type-1 domain-containing protein n=1 Tax=Linum trigynum TaxID=586398 RepID=A0AAV2EYZ9_9ROSI
MQLFATQGARLVLLSVGQTSMWCWQLVYITKVYLAERLPVRDAITFLASSSLTHVIVEGDSEVVINQIRQGVIEGSFGGPMLRKCRQILDSLSVCMEFKAVPRAANSAAHRVALKALLLSLLELESFDFWVASLGCSL